MKRTKLWWWAGLNSTQRMLLRSIEKDVKKSNYSELAYPWIKNDLTTWGELRAELIAKADNAVQFLNERGLGERSGIKCQQKDF